MELLFHKLFGISSKPSPSQDKSHQKESKRRSYRSCGTSVDRDVLKNAGKFQNSDTRKNHVDSAGSLLSYTLNNEDVTRHVKRIGKYNKHKLFRISTRSGNTRGPSQPAAKAGSQKPALLLITRQDPGLLIKSHVTEPEDSGFDKFIPVDNFERSVYRLAELDRHFPLCWFDIQTWYREIRAHRLEHEQKSSSADVRSSHSDTSVYCTESGINLKQSEPNDSLPKPYINPEGPTKTTDQLVKDNRFGLAVNETYCQITCSITPSYVIELLIQLPGKADMSLCHLKTEMIVYCIQKFFYPIADIHVMWAQDLKSQALRLCSVRGLKRHLPVPPENWITDEDSASVDYQDKAFQEMQALMIVSSDAAVLLKHGKLCFLETLAVISEIRPEKLLVLQQVRKSKQLSVIREISPRH